ncbi:MAG: hypothetical protein AMXMBFR6_11840 [Betaproteobacteria bacterium]
MQRTLPAAVVAALLCIAPSTRASETDARLEIERLRTEFEQRLRQLQEDYEKRLRALEARSERVGDTGMSARTADAAGAPAVPTASTPSGTGFNPEISLILQGSYQQRKDLAERGLSGFLGAGHEHGSERGFRLDHSELVMQANVDTNFRAYLNAALVDGQAEVEEAWFQTLGLGQGMSVKGGRFYSRLGYLNTQHPHAWDFADAPLMYRAQFGERFSHDGLQLSWVAPTETYLELGAEAGRGDRFPGSSGGGNRNGAGAWTLFAKLGGDIGESHSWRAGLAQLSARPLARPGHWEDDAGVETEVAWSGLSRTWVADFIWKWAPDGNPVERNFKLQGEYFRRREGGDLSCIDNTAAGGACAGVSDRYDSTQSGWYAQAVYQFMPRWRTGMRYDRLDSGSQALGPGFAGMLSTTDFRPSRWSLMADYSPSEYARLRVQFARDRSQLGLTENQITLQYQMSLGSHGAHRF